MVRELLLTAKAADFIETAKLVSLNPHQDFAEANLSGVLI